MDKKQFKKFLRNIQISLGIREISLHSPESGRRFYQADAKTKKMLGYRKKFFRHEQHK